MKTMKKASSSKSMTKAKYGIKVNDKKTDRKNKRAEKKASNYKPKPLPKSNSISASDLEKIRSTPKFDYKAKTTCGPKGCSPAHTKVRRSPKAMLGKEVESSSKPKPRKKRTNSRGVPTFKPKALPKGKACTSKGCN